MKTLLISAVILMASSGYSFTSAPRQSQDRVVSVSVQNQTSEFGYFRAHRQGKRGVALAWGISSPNGVAGFIVERSYDGDFYENISQMPCNGLMKLNFKDEDVFPGFIRYRVTCVMEDGSTHSTPIETVRITQHG